MEEADFKKQREELVKKLVGEKTIESREIKNAFLKVKREEFMQKEKRKLAYQDNAFSIGHGQTISQPTTIAIMLEMLRLKKGMSVLEIGSGSGYVLALVSEIAGQKNTVGAEVIPELAELGRKNLNANGYGRIKIYNKNAVREKFQEKCFDRIIVSCASKKVPDGLKEKLKEKGIMVMPVGGRMGQDIIAFKKEKLLLREIERRQYFAFVSLKE